MSSSDGEWTYHYLNAFMRGAAGAKELCNNTYVADAFFDGLAYDVLLHGNLIGMSYYNGIVAMRTCGWNTPTTCSRLRRLVDPDMYQVHISQGLIRVRLTNNKGRTVVVPEQEFVVLSTNETYTFSNYASRNLPKELANG